jgi:hypothetical protein
MSLMISAASAAITVARKRTDTLPDSRPTTLSNMSYLLTNTCQQSLAAMRSLILPRREGSSRGWRRPCGQQCTAFIRLLVLRVCTYPANSTSRSTQKARLRTIDPVLGPRSAPRVARHGPRWAAWGALAEHVHQQSASCWNAQQVFPANIQEHGGGYCTPMSPVEVISPPTKHIKCGRSHPAVWSTSVDGGSLPSRGNNSC